MLSSGYSCSSTGQFTNQTEVLMLTLSWLFDHAVFIALIGAIVAIAWWQRKPLQRTSASLWNWLKPGLGKGGKAFWAWLKPSKDAPDPAAEKDGVVGHPTQYRLYQLLALAVYLIVLPISFIFWNAGFTPLGTDLNFGPAGLLAVALHLIASLREVRADETAGAFSFGKALKRLAS